MIKSTMQRVPLSINPLVQRTEELLPQVEIASRAPDKPLARNRFPGFHRRTRGFVAALALLAGTGCTETLVGFRAEFASNTMAVRVEAPAGDRLRFRMPKRGTDLQQNNLYYRPHRAVLHLSGYLPLTPDGIDDAGDSYEVRITLPQDLVKLASNATPNTHRVRGELYVPTETGVVSFTGVELREPASARTISVSLAAVHAGPLTSMAESVGAFLRGLYSAR